MSEKSEKRLRRTIRTVIILIMSNMGFIDRFKFVYLGKVDLAKHLNIHLPTNQQEEKSNV